MSEKELTTQEERQISMYNEPPLGFEDESEGDLIVPRIKVVQLLSPEFKEKIADEGDIINSLTKEKYNDQVFIPVFKFNNNIWWKPRSEGGGMYCISRDGKVGNPTDGSASLMCAMCRKNEFDNTKQGRDAIPVCTKYINFFGFIRGSAMPIILSFAKTNYNEGKKMFSLAKVTMQNMWNHGYTLSSKKMSKAGNEWYNIVVTAAGPTTEEERQAGMAMYQMFRKQDFNFDIDESANFDAADNPVPGDENTEF